MVSRGYEVDLLSQKGLQVPPNIKAPPPNVTTDFRGVGFYIRVP